VFLIADDELSIPAQYLSARRLSKPHDLRVLPGIARASFIHHQGLPH